MPVCPQPPVTRREGIAVSFHSMRRPGLDTTSFVAERLAKMAGADTEEVFAVAVVDAKFRTCFNGSSNRPFGIRAIVAGNTGEEHG